MYLYYVFQINCISITTTLDAMRVLKQHIQ